MGGLAQIKIEEKAKAEAEVGKSKTKIPSPDREEGGISPGDEKKE